MTVHYGSILGTYSDFRKDVQVFRGIPYADDTGGSNRWKPPLKPSNYSGLLDATEFGANCPQTDISPSIFSSPNTNISEDCLNLNIWRPANASTGDNLPVFVWIYGGRFSGGSGDVRTYDGAGLASKGIIVVTLNYRLGPFGFLAHPALSAESGYNSSGNYGLLDMQAALHWVNEEIAHFGGDTNRVTVGGQSAGSSAALDMMFSPLSRDLIAGCIAESGARGTHDPLTGSLATSYRHKGPAEANGISVLKSLNVSTIAQARKLSMAALLTEDNLSDTIFEGTRFENISNFSEPPEFRPVLDGYVLTHSYTDALRLNAHADVPTLTGNNADESGAVPNPSTSLSTYKSNFTAMFANLSSEFFSLYPTANATQAADETNEFWRDLSRVGTWQWASAWTAGGAKSTVYTYYWTHAPPNQTSGAYHGSELWYTFNNLPYSDAAMPWTKTDYAIEGRMSEYWANFIRKGNPNGGNLTDFPASETKAETMWLGDEWGVGMAANTEKKVEFVGKWLSALAPW